MTDSVSQHLTITTLLITRSQLGSSPFIYLILYGSWTLPVYGISRTSGKIFGCVTNLRGELEQLTVVTSPYQAHEARGRGIERTSSTLKLITKQVRQHSMWHGAVLPNKNITKLGITQEMGKIRTYYRLGK